MLLPAPQKWLSQNLEPPSYSMAWKSSFSHYLNWGIWGPSLRQPRMACHILHDGWFNAQGKLVMLWQCPDQHGPLSHLVLQWWFSNSQTLKTRLFPPIVIPQALHTVAAMAHRSAARCPAPHPDDSWARQPGTRWSTASGSPAGRRCLRGTSGRPGGMGWKTGKWRWNWVKNGELPSKNGDLTQEMFGYNHWMTLEKSFLGLENAGGTWFNFVKFVDFGVTWLSTRYPSCMGSTRKWQISLISQITRTVESWKGEKWKKQWMSQTRREISKYCNGNILITDQFSGYPPFGQTQMSTGSTMADPPCPQRQEHCWTKATNRRFTCHGSTQHEPTGIRQTSKTSRAPLPPRRKQTRAARKCRSVPCLEMLQCLDYLHQRCCPKTQQNSQKWSPCESCLQTSFCWWLHWNRTPYFAWLNHCQTSVKPLIFS